MLKSQFCIILLALCSPFQSLLGQSVSDLRGELEHLQRWAQKTPQMATIEPEREKQWQNLERFAAKVEQLDLDNSRRTMVADKQSPPAKELQTEDSVSQAMSAPARVEDSSATPIEDAPSHQPFKRRRRSFTPSR